MDADLRRRDGAADVDIALRFERHIRKRTGKRRAAPGLDHAADEHVAFGVQQHRRRALCGDAVAVTRLRAAEQRRVVQAQADPGVDVDLVR